MNDNIRSLPKPETSDLRKLIETAKRQMPEHLELARLRAEADFALFTAYQKAGFTTEQSLSLLRAEKRRD